MHGYLQRSFHATLHDGTPVTHDVYERGDGPPVVLVQELPGIGPQTLRLAERLVAAGYHVVLPHLLGPLGRVSFVGNVGRALCMRRELRMFASHQSSPVVGWLRALCRDVRERRGVAGVGVIGMCLTGNFAITLIADDAVLAAVASQPSLPPAPWQGLHMSPAEIQASREALTTKGPMLAFRFEGDHLCTAKKFAAIDAAFNDDRERVRLVTLPGKGHSVLTLHFVDEQGHPTQQALQSVLEYFERTLGQ
jgi:dienelactone hydrolase